MEIGFCQNRFLDPRVSRPNKEAYKLVEQVLFLASCLLELKMHLLWFKPLGSALLRRRSIKSNLFPFQDFRAICPNLQCLCMDPVHLAIVYMSMPNGAKGHLKPIKQTQPVEHGHGEDSTLHPQA